VRKIKKEEKLIDLKETYFFCFNKRVTFVRDGPDRADTHDKKLESPYMRMPMVGPRRDTNWRRRCLLWSKAMKSRGARCSSHRNDGACLKEDIFINKKGETRRSRRNIPPLPQQHGDDAWGMGRADTRIYKI
jgi:hypothetical protein